MQSSTLFKVVILCVFAYSIFSFFSFRGGDFSYTFGSSVGSGPMITKEFDLEDFHSIALSLPANVDIKYGTSNRVKVEAPEDIMEHLNTDVDNGRWKVKLNKRMNWRSHKDINIWVEMDNVKAFSVAGSGDIEMKDHFENLDKVDFSIAGSGNILFRGDANKLDASVSGSGDVELFGSADDCDLSVSGSGEFDALEFAVKNCDVSISGSGEANLNVSESLDASVSGSGDIAYKGTPKVNSKISGSGSVRTID